MYKSALAMLAAAGTLMLPAATSHAASAAQAKSPWQAFPQASLDGGGAVLALGWAENRFWVATTTKNTPILHSARLAGARLTGFTQTRVPRNSIIQYPIVEGELVVNGVNSTNEHYTAQLLANGRLGAMKAVPDDLLARGKEAVPRLDGLSIADGARIGDRTIWALDGWPAQDCRSRCGGFFLACCSVSGAAVDLTDSVEGREPKLFPHVGRDAQGRIWFAWLDNRAFRGAVAGYPRLLELDPSTLEPRSKSVAMPGVSATRIGLACAASCRIVAQSAEGDIVSWGPGERSPTRVASHAKHPFVKGATAPAWLVAAAYQSGDLVVGYHVSTFSRKGPRDEIRVVRGNDRGANPRVVGGIPLLDSWPPGDRRQPYSSPFPIFGTFAPRGLVVTTVFQYTPGPLVPSPLVGIVVPVGRR